MVLVHLGTCLPRNLSTRPFVYPGTCPPRNLKLSCLEQIDRLQNVHTQARQCQEDTKLPRMAALPRWSRMPILLQRWEMASPSSCPMCLARAAPSFFTSLPAPTCQSPNDALSPTLLFCPVHFSVKGMVLSVIGCVGRCWHGGSLEGRYYGSVVISPRLQRHICH